MDRINRIVKMIAALSLILGYASCGEDSDPVSPSPEPEPGVFEFLEPVFYPVEEYAGSIVAADLDADGDNDLVVQRCCNNRIGILLNNGDGTFQQEQYLTISEAFIVYTIASADLDGDGDCDIVAGWYQSTVYVLLSNGDATFQSPLPLTEESIGTVRRIEAVDLDLDGDEDLLVATESPDRIVTFLNNGDATFGVPVQVLEGYANALTMSDLDHDGDADMVGAAGPAVFTSIGNGDGTFQDAVYQGFLLWDFLSEHFEFCLPLDIDSDGDFDIAAGSLSRGTYMLLNAGDFTFNMAGCYGEAKGLKGAAAADMDLDGENEIVGTFSEIDSIAVFHDSGDSTFQSFVSYFAGIAMRSFALADLDGDGDIDIAGNDYRSVFVMLNTLNDRDL